MTVSTLDIMQIGMQFSDNAKQKRADAEKIFRRAHNRHVKIVAGTEAGPGSGPLLHYLHEAAVADDYWFWNQSACWLAIHKSIIEGKVQKHWHKVIEGKANQYPTKGTMVAEFATPHWGTIHYAVGHLLTKGRPDAKTAANRRYLDENIVLAADLGDYMAKNARGRDLGFYSGDQNIIDKTNDTFLGQARMVSCWDELGKWPNTGHGNIDVVAKYAPDSRSECDYARVLDDREFSLNTDHFLLEVGYSIRHLA